MRKRIDLLVRGDDVSHEAFVESWRSTYLPRLRDAEAVVRSQQVLPTQPEHAEFDGLSEVYVESPDALEDGSVPPIDEVLPVAEHRQFTGEETVQRDDVDGDTDGLYKHSAFLVRQDGMSHEAFVDYWQTNHTPIAREIEGVVKYDTVVPTDPASTAFDGVAELYFEDLDALHDALGSEGSRDYDPTKGKAAEAREDVDNFLAVDERPRLIGRNHLVKG
ncbi:ethyl tert-butyl ether degradation EthD [Salinarchaeum sp. Harcht-Bsk1]|uniref:EthD domain-containing protein n=1 Tax=Salinarchaeum sp. Harcht-Bsk1 TaxID=1333523 RepID=UPI0003424153|nr:EthD domain-containing protein [Salinarchaeum sp. Harcht-Bsk1]AGN00449.1 ethyl tert-butyl ether degradation EthD [Salinarchaeum sp. Harcht-Bsk1]